jgi:LPXTG-motif cell wall-anchored protein
VFPATLTRDHGHIRTILIVALATLLLFAAAAPAAKADPPEKVVSYVFVFQHTDGTFSQRSQSSVEAIGTSWDVVVPDAGGSTEAGDPSGMTIHMSCSDTFGDVLANPDDTTRGWSDDGAGGHPNPAADPEWRVYDYWIQRPGTNGGRCGTPPEPVPPQLTLVKNVVNDDGGQTGASAWTLSAVGGTDGFAKTGTPTTTADSKAVVGPETMTAAVTYALSESDIAGYTISVDWSCNGGRFVEATNTITLALDDDVTCEITNNDIPEEPEGASLTIVKNTINRNGTFAFEIAALDEIQIEALGDFEITTASLTGSKVFTFEDFDGDTFRVAEVLPLGPRWSFVDVTCDAKVQELDPKNAVAKVYVGAGDHFTCTFTNRYTRETTDPDEPDIDITKYTNGEDANRAEFDEIPEITPGFPVSWTYEVVNTGDVDLIDVKVTDDAGTSADTGDDFDATCPQTTLAVGKSMTCRAQGIAGTVNYTNIGTATGFYLAGTVTATDPSAYNPVAVGGTAQLGDTVWLDVNKNGVQDNGEVGYNGADVILKDADGNVVGTLTTATGAWVGFYSFVGLDAGTYTAMLDLSTIGTYKVSTANSFTVTLAEGDEYLDADFGLYQAPPTTTVPPEETLPTTGADSEGLIALAVGLLMLGGLAILATRKRRSTN